MYTKFRYKWSLKEEIAKHNKRKRRSESSDHLSSTMKTKYYFLAKKSFTVEESITYSLNV